jgi:hypothetical protein
MKQKNMKVRLEKIKRTDLICVGCGNFRTDWAIVPRSGVEPVAGVHSGCIGSLHVKSVRKKEFAPPASVGLE